MKIGIIGSGHIGGNAGRLFARAGHEVLFSFSRDPQTLADAAAAAGPLARTGTPREAVEFGAIVMLSVPWGVIDEALAQAGSLDGTIVIDTTNQFSQGGVVALPGGISAAVYNQRRMPGARLVKAYNTLTAGFQAAAAGRSGPDRVVMFYAGEDPDAKATVATLIEDSGFTPVDMGGWATVHYMEAPRRSGAVYGEEYHLEEAREFVARVAQGR
jgi:predicted dinucleotide-binding enzyme